ncbi:PE-PPE domain-containing protein [Mycobacterium sp.]|uniref:PE-PPE domain-containing protein n=1 Tax=Mycobacterium sp. TaxID=1785 RepID=UPI003A899B6D
MIMSPSGISVPDAKYMGNARNWMDAGYVFDPANPANFPLSTNEGLYPITAVKDLELTPSINRGLQELYNGLFGPYGTITQGTATTVFGYSQSSMLSSLLMQQLMASGSPNTDLLSFSLVGNEMNPNGGMLSRFPGLNLAALGIDFYGATPAGSGYPVYNYALEYDGFVDFPRYPLNVLSDLNAFMGIAFVHTTHMDYDPNNLPPGYSLVEMPISPESEANYPGLNNYDVITYGQLPLLTPLRWLPVIGDPLADLVQPNLR